jgi:hypothetical protein
MLDIIKLENNVNQFLAFLELSNQTNLSREIQAFFADSSSQAEKKEVVHDRGALMLFKDDCLISQFELNKGYSDDRVIKFDGKNISDINPIAYLGNHNSKVVNEIHMKGDGSGKGRRSGSSSSGTSSNNNNNNNNNG